MSNSATAAKPLVAYLNGRDCHEELEQIRDIARVAFCDSKNAAELRNQVYDEAVVVFFYQNLRITRETLMMFKSLRLIIKTGCNCDDIDVETATEKNVAVSLVSGSTDEVADTTLSFILNLYRQMFHMVDILKDGQNVYRLENVCDFAKGTSRISGQVLGIVGLGRIGSAVALRAMAFGFTVICYDPYLESSYEMSLGVKRVATLEELLSSSDCVSLHCTCSRQNWHMLNEKSLTLMRSGAFLVNTANGNLICERALAKALKAGRIRGAALDVYEMDSFSLQNSPLRDCPNLLCTPNTAFYSDLSFQELKQKVAEEIRRGVKGIIPEELLFCINREALFKKSENKNIANNYNTNQSSIPFASNQLPQLQPNHIHQALQAGAVMNQSSASQAFQHLNAAVWPIPPTIPQMEIINRKSSWPTVYVSDPPLLPFATPFQSAAGVGQHGAQPQVPLTQPQMPLPVASNSTSSSTYNPVAGQLFHRP